MDMTLGLIVLAVTLLAGVLMGYTFTVRALDARTRWQAAVQRSLNSQQQELESQWQELDSQWHELEIAQRTVTQRHERELSKPVRS